MKASRIKDIMWRRHRHPASGWSRAALSVPLVAGVWLHWFWLVGLSALLVATNPFWFSDPGPEARSFMTRVVDGERLWLARAGLAERLTILVPGAFLAAGLGYSLWMRLAGWSLFFGLGALAFKCFHVAWMARVALEEVD